MALPSDSAEFLLDNLKQLLTSAQAHIHPPEPQFLWIGSGRVYTVIRLSLALIVPAARFYVELQQTSRMVSQRVPIEQRLGRISHSEDPLRRSAVPDNEEYPLGPCALHLLIESDREREEATRNRTYAYIAHSLKYR